MASCGRGIPKTGTLLALGRPAEAHRVSHFQADRNGHRLLTVTNDGVVQVWDAETATPSTPPLCGPVAIAATFSPDGRRVMVLDEKGAVVSWDLAAAEPEGWNIGIGNGTSRPTFTPDGGRVLVAEHQQMPVHAWNLATAQPAELPLNWPGTALQGSLSADGRRSLTIVNPVMTRPQRNQIVSAPGDETPSLRESLNVRMRAASPPTPCSPFPARWMSACSCFSLAALPHGFPNPANSLVTLK